MSETRVIQVEAEEGRLDLFLRRQVPELTRAQIQRLIKEGRARVNDRPAKASLKLRPGDRVTLTIPPPSPLQVVPQAIPIEVVYEDADLLVVDKPPGMPVHPAPGHTSRTLVNALLARCPDLSGVGGTLRPGIVHRLDKDTSGLLVVAKNDRAHHSLSKQIKERSLKKGYLALVRGHMEPAEGWVEGPIGRDPRNRKKMAVVPGGKEARTFYRLVRRVKGYSLVEVFPHTGRTHQIRVHLAFLGFPVVGDATYGIKAPFLSRQFLHAHLLGFRLPGDGEYREFTSPLPQDLAAALALLEGE